MRCIDKGSKFEDKSRKEIEKMRKPANTDACISNTYILLNLPFWNLY